MNDKKPKYDIVLEYFMPTQKVKIAGSEFPEMVVESYVDVSTVKCLYLNSVSGKIETINVKTIILIKCS